MTRLLTSAACALLLLLPSRPALAQGRFNSLAPDTSGEPTQVLSTNPIGLAVRYLNFEYETQVGVGSGLTAGIGAAHLPKSVGLGAGYGNGDIFIRYYPGGRVFHGISLDLKTGLTASGGDSVALGAGFDVNATHRLSERVVMSAGIGLKRVFAGDDSFVLPTIRIFNIGVGF